MPSVALRSPGITVFLLEELVAALHTNKPDTFKRWQAQQQQAQQWNDYKTAVTAEADSSPACKAPWI